MINENLENQIWNQENRVDVNEQVIEGIIEWFENIKTRPECFYGEKNPTLVENGMYWFQMAFVHLGYKFKRHFERNAIIKRSLNENVKSLERQLRERGLSDEQIVNEIIDIEI